MQPAPVAHSEISLDSVESLIYQLVHDLRQPLSNIQSCACCLDLAMRSGQRGAMTHVQMIDRQVEEANELLEAAVKRVRLLRQAGCEESLARTNSVTAAVT